MEIQYLLDTHTHKHTKKRNDTIIRTKIWHSVGTTILSRKNGKPTTYCIEIKADVRNGHMRRYLATR